MPRITDDQSGRASKVGAAAFGVALTLPMGLAAPAEALNACACGGGGAAASPAAGDDAPAPAAHPAPPARQVSPPPASGPPPGTTVRQLQEPDAPPAPPRRTRTDPPTTPPSSGPPPGTTVRQLQEPDAPPAPPRRRRPDSPGPAPAGAPTPPRTGADQLIDEVTDATPQPPQPRNLEELLTGPARTPSDRKPASGPPPGTTARQLAERDRPVDSDPAPVDPDPAPVETDPAPVRHRTPAQPRNAVDELIENVTSTDPQPEPPRYLSDLMLPGVDLGTQPAPPPKQYSQPRERKPGETDLEYLLTAPLDEPRPEPKPIGPPPDIGDMDPIAQDEFIAQNPMSLTFYTEADRAAARQRLQEDDLVVDEVLSPEDDRNPERNEFRMEHADPLPPPPEPEPEPEEEGMSGMDKFQEGLSYGGFIPGAGAIPDLINAPIYAFRGKWGEAGWSLGAAVPIIGDGANGIRKGKKIYGAVDEAIDAGRHADEVVDAGRAVTRGSPEAATDKFLSTRPKIDSSDESLAALDAIMRRTTSGTRANASNPGKFNPVHTRGHSAELRTLDDLGARSDVTRITPVPAARGSRTPDFVVTRADGTQVRVEVTTVTGAPRGRVDRGLGSAAPPSQRDIENAITRKTSTSSSSPNQFQADLGDVPKGGTLAVHLRGGGTAQMADDAVTAQAAGLRKSGVDSVEIYTSDRQVLKYTRQPDGSFSR